MCTFPLRCWVSPQEITRRVNLHNIWQAVYTAGVVLPKPVAECQYWHRSLNPKKLINIGFRQDRLLLHALCAMQQTVFAGNVLFLTVSCVVDIICSRLGARMTMARTLKLYKLPEQPQTPGLRQMEDRDVPEVAALLAEYLQAYSIAPVLDEAEVRHWLSHQVGLPPPHVAPEKPAFPMWDGVLPAGARVCYVQAARARRAAAGSGPFLRRGGARGRHHRPAQLLHAAQLGHWQRSIRQLEGE